MKVLITGATGFLGSHLCRRIVEEGHEVRVLIRPTSNSEILQGLSMERVIGDVTDPKSLKAAIRDQDWVIHAAASLSGDPGRQNKVNVEGTHHVAEACREQG